MSNPNMISRSVASSVGVTYLTKRNPWSAVWWSVVLPGFGHLYLGQHMKSFILMSWEIIVNDRAHLNLAIFHTVLGDIEQAKAVLDPRWAILYPLFYLFSMIDSYRIGIELNQLADMEHLQKKRRIDRAVTSILGMQSLEQRHPVYAAFWSAMMVGLGQMYCNRNLRALILMGWYIVVVMKSGLSLAAFHTVLGNWEQAHQSLDYQWLLFWPSIYIFGIVDAYGCTVEQNVVSRMGFKYRIRKYLRNPGTETGARALS